MTKPQLLDVIELLADLPDAALQAGDLGTIIEEYDDSAYEIEFADSDGETLALQALRPDQFVVVWQNSTKTWVSLTERISAMLQTLPEERQQQVLNFARSLHKTPA